MQVGIVAATSRKQRMHTVFRTMEISSFFISKVNFLLWKMSHPSGSALPLSH